MPCGLVKNFGKCLVKAIIVIVNSHMQRLLSKVFHNSSLTLSKVVFMSSDHLDYITVIDYIIVIPDSGGVLL